MNSKDDFYSKLIGSEPHCFEKAKSRVIGRLDEYMNYFIAHVYSMSENKF
jgi:hypothetical protein